MALNDRGHPATTGLEPRGQGRAKARWLLPSIAAVIVLALVLYLAGCANEPAPGADVTAGRIIEDPSAYVGKTLTVSGDVEDVHGPRAFTMDSGLQVGDLLVIGADPFPQVAGAPAGSRGYLGDDTAKVTGTVRMLVTAEIEREVGWDLDPALEIEFERKPVLIAKTIGFTAGRGTPSSASPGAYGAAPSPGSGMASSSAEPITDVLVIVTPVDRTPLVGRRVRLADVKVHSVVGDRTFWIGPGDRQRMLVVLDKDLDRPALQDRRLDVNAGQTVTIEGEVRTVPSAEEVQSRWKGLSAAERAPLPNERVYLHAERVDIAATK